jgi:NADP-dependent 3-hydroxy acid dehydrogenase YdfG
MRKLENKVAIVTGAASGLGKAITLLYTAEGAKVVAADINEKTLNELKTEIERKGGTITAVVTNTANADDIENMVKQAVKAYGTVDILALGSGDGGQPERTL